MWQFLGISTLAHITRSVFVPLQQAYQLVIGFCVDKEPSVRFCVRPIEALSETYLLVLLHTQVFHYTAQHLRALLLELGSRAEPIVPVTLTVEQCVYFIHSHHCLHYFQ